MDGARVRACGDEWPPGHLLGRGGAPTALPLSPPFRAPRRQLPAVQTLPWPLPRLPPHPQAGGAEAGGGALDGERLLYHTLLELYLSDGPQVW